MPCARDRRHAGVWTNWRCRRSAYDRTPGYRPSLAALPLVIVGSSVNTRSLEATRSKAHTTLTERSASCQERELKKQRVLGRVVGIDGCKGGWLAVRFDPLARTLTPLMHPSFAEILDAYHDAAAIGVDIPIGLSQGDPRLCDLQARKAIAPRGSSVFPAPDATLLDKMFDVEGQPLPYHQVLALARSCIGKGIAKQVYFICRKIAEVNREMTPSLQQRVIEVHPEVSFRAIAGRSIAHPKRKPAGYDERRELLQEALDTSIWSREEARAVARPAQPDDLLDATVVAWTAYRFARVIAEHLPPEPPVDRSGLRMEIVF